MAKYSSWSQQFRTKGKKWNGFDNWAGAGCRSTWNLGCGSMFNTEKVPFLTSMEGIIKFRPLLGYMDITNSTSLKLWSSLLMMAISFSWTLSNEVLTHVHGEIQSTQKYIKTSQRQQNHQNDDIKHENKYPTMLHSSRWWTMTKEKCDELLVQYINGGQNPNRLRAVAVQ